MTVKENKKQRNMRNSLNVEEITKRKKQREGGRAEKREMSREERRERKKRLISAVQLGPQRPLSYRAELRSALSREAPAGGGRGGLLHTAARAPLPSTLGSAAGRLSLKTPTPGSPSVPFLTEKTVSESVLN